MSHLTQAAFEARIREIQDRCSQQTQRGNEYFLKFDEEQKARLAAEAKARKLQEELDGLKRVHGICRQCDKTHRYINGNGLCNDCCDGCGGEATVEVNSNPPTHLCPNCNQERLEDMV